MINKQKSKNDEDNLGDKEKNTRVEGEKNQKCYQKNEANIMVKIPDELIEQIYEGNAVLFVGSGLSMNAGFPSWSELIHRMITWCEEQSIMLNSQVTIGHL